MKRYLAATMLLAAVAPAGAQGNHLLSQFTMLSVPRQDVPIGAVWQQGTGPDGDGLAEEDLRVSGSLAAFVSNSTTRLQTEARILRWLNLSAGLRSATRIEFENVDIVTVANITNSRAQPGNQILYEGLRAGSFRLVTDAARAAELGSAVRANVDTSRVSVAVGSDNSIKLSGANLFVGYRVITLRDPQTNVRERDLKDASDDQGSPLKVGDYTFKFDVRDLMRCSCPNGMGSTPKNCRGPMVVTADNPQLGSIGSGGLVKQFRYLYNEVNQGPVVLDVRPRSGAIEVDRVQFEAPVLNITSSCMMIGRSFRHGKAKVTRTRYSFQPFPNPSAPGW